MMPEILTESFCERCGTRYTFEATAPVKAKKLGKFKTLSKGLKNYVLSDETSMDEAMAAARSDEERELTAQQLEAFQSTFNFCMTCRQYTCANCWNAAEGACLTCAPLNGYVTPSTTFLDLAPLVPIEPLGTESSPWPTREVSREPAAAVAATPWPDELAAAETPPVAADALADEAASLASAATAWPIEAEQAATAQATPEAVAETEIAEAVIAEAVIAEAVIAEAVIAEAVIAEAVIAEADLAEAELAAAPEAADWAMAEAEASHEARPEVVDDILVVAASEPEPAPAEVAADDEVAVEVVAVEPDRAHVDGYAFESDIAPAIAELPDTDLRAADAARRTSDLLSRLRPAASTAPEPEIFAPTVEPEPVADAMPAAEPFAAATSIPAVTPIIEVIAEAATPTEEPVPLQAEAAAEYEVADDVIGDYQVADTTPEEPAAVAPWPDDMPVALPAELLAIIGPPIEAAPEPAVELVAEPIEAAVEAEAMPDEAVAEPPHIAAAAQAEPVEPAATPVDPEAEPARADVVEQPMWRIVAPDPAAPPTNGHTPIPEPISPVVVAKAPVEPAAPVEPQWPTPPAPLPLPDAPYLVSRRTSDASEGLWAASARGVVAQAPGAPVLAVQTCGSCGLSLSATARFCRRCGTRQGG
jgi:hypothetical protein